MNAATHEFLPEEVMALLDGELSPERAAVVSAHLETCKECCAVAAEFRSVTGQIKSWQITEFPASVGETATAPKLEHVIAETSLLGPAAKWRLSSPFRKLAIAGSCVGVFLLLMAISVPNLLRSRMASNEASAVGSLRAINTAAVAYLDSYGHYPFSLRSLGGSAGGTATEEHAMLIDQVLAAGRKSGYSFTYRTYKPFGSSLAGTYTIQADPVEPEKSGLRHFSTDQTGVLFADGMELGGIVTASRGSLGKLEQKTPLNGRSPQDLVLLTPGPMIARNVSLSIVVKDFDAGRTSLDAILARHNGYAANLSSSTPQGAARVIQASLRIPAPQLAAAIGELKSLGRVEGETQSGEEVTQQHADLVARTKNDRETEQRLQDILRTRTGKVKDVLEVQQEIARVRGEIEQMEAEQKTLEHHVEFATIDLKLAEEYKAQLSTPAPSVWMQLRNATINGFRNALETLLSIVLFFAESGPSIVLWLAIFACPAWLVWRRYRRMHAVGTLGGA